MKIRNLIEIPDLGHSVSSTEFLYLNRFKNEFHTLNGKAELRIPFSLQFPFAPPMPKENPGLKNNPGKMQHAFPGKVSWAQADLWERAKHLSMKAGTFDRALARALREREDTKAAAEERYQYDILTQKFRIDLTKLQAYVKEALFRELKKSEFTKHYVSKQIEHNVQKRDDLHMKDLYREQRGWDEPSCLPGPLQSSGARNLTEYQDEQRIKHITSLSSQFKSLHEILKQHDEQMYFMQATYGMILTGNMMVAEAQAGAPKTSVKTGEDVTPVKTIRLLT